MQQEVWGGAPEVTFLTTSQVMPGDAASWETH